MITLAVIVVAASVLVGVVGWITDDRFRPPSLDTAEVSGERFPRRTG